MQDLDRSHPRVLDGTLHLWIKGGREWITLKNARGIALEGKDLVSGDLIDFGSEVIFPSHHVFVGACMHAPPGVIDDKGYATPFVSRATGKQTAGSISENKTVDQGLSVSDPSFAVHTSVSLGLDFSLGTRFANAINREFRTSVHPNNGSDFFIMVVSFGRACFKLDCDIVGLALEAAIGGFCDDLQVSLLDNRTFSFRVSCMQVGFKVYNLKSFACKQFKCFFHLWGRGGPNWKREFFLWQKEQDLEWTIVSPIKLRTQLALKAMQQPIIKSKDTPRKKLVFF